MEDYYFLNHDCISCFHIITFKIYYQMLLINRSFFSNINHIDHLKIVYNFRHKPKVRCVNINLFPKLTSLHVSCNKPSDSILNLRAYEFNFSKIGLNYPRLQKLKIINCVPPANFNHPILWNNLCNLCISNPSLSIDTLNKFSKLTSLTFRMRQNDNKIFHTLNCLYNLVKLKMKTINYVVQNIEHASLTNLKSLTINVTRNQSTLYVSIGHPNLTYLKISVCKNTSSCKLDIHRQTNLLSLKILNIYMRCADNYFKQATDLRVLKLCGSFWFGSYLELSYQYNSKLTYLKICSYDHVTLNYMTNLKTKILNNVKMITEL